MSLVKVAIIVGTRPEAIKLAPVIINLQKRSDRFQPIVYVTGQHSDMVDNILELFQIVPDIDLHVMQPNQTLSGLTSSLMNKIDKTIFRTSPDLVLVQGDTTTAFCGALSSFYHQIPVGHVEAGLRTYNKSFPFPEEMNRTLITRLSDYHFAPTETAKKSLLKEGVQRSSVFVTGNTIVDAILWVRSKTSDMPPELPPALLRALEGRRMILVTGHRRESFQQGLESVCRAIRDTVQTFSDVVFVYPVHPNPNVRTPVYRILNGHERIHLIDPLPYAPFVWLMEQAYFILTDSGGIQEEAPVLGTPVLVTRELTERPEGIASNNACLIGTRKDSIIQTMTSLLRDHRAVEAMSVPNRLYGDGEAAARIGDILERLRRPDVPYGSPLKTRKTQW